MSQNHSKYVKSSTKAILAAAVLAGTIAPYSVQASTEITTAAQATTAINSLDPTKGMAYVEEVKAINSAVTSKKLVLATAAKVSLLYHTQAIAVVEEIEKLITKSGDISAITTKSGLDDITAEITPVKASYSKLSATARGYVKNYSKLTDLETTVKNRATAIQYEVYLVDFRLAMVKLSTTKTVNLADVKTGADFTLLTDEQKYSVQELSDIVAARTEYNKLTTTLKALVSTELTKIVAHETQANYQKALVALIDTEAATSFTSKVNKLDTIAPDYPAQVDTLNGELAAFTSSVVSQISTSTKVSLTYHTQAAAVVTAIKGLQKAPTSYTVSVIELADQETLNSIKSAVAAVRGEYSKLSSTARAYVGNVSDLQALESAITARQNYFNNASALSYWTAAYKEIKELTSIDFTGVTGFNFNSAPRKYTTSQIDNIIKANTEYNKLTSTLKQLVAENQSKLLADLVAANTRQAQLQAESNSLAPWKAAYVKISGLDVQKLAGVTAYTFADTAENLKYSSDQLGFIVEADKQFKAIETLKGLVPEPDVDKLNEHIAAAANQTALQTKSDNLATWKAAYVKISGLDVQKLAGVTAYTFADTAENLKYSSEQLGWIEAAKAPHEALNADSALQELVPDANRTIVTNHINAAKNQTDLQGQATSLATWIAAYKNIKDVPVKKLEGVTALTFAGTSVDLKYTEEQLGFINAAKAPHEALNADSALQALVPDPDRKLVTDHIAAAANQIALQTAARSATVWNEAFGKIKNLPLQTFTDVTPFTFTTSTPKYNEGQLADIAEAKKQYDDLSTTLKGEVSTEDRVKLTNHVSAAATQNDLQTKANALSGWITAYDKIKNVTVQLFTDVTAAKFTASTPQYGEQLLLDIAAAKKAYDEIAPAETKKLVPDEDVKILNNHVSAAAKQDDLKTKAATSLADWIAAYGKIDYTPFSFSGVTAATYAEKYTADAVLDIEDARAKLDWITDPALLKEIPSADVTKLKTHEAAVTRQGELKTAHTELEAEKTAFKTEYAKLEGISVDIKSDTTLAEFKVAGFTTYNSAQVATIRKVRALYASSSLLAKAVVTSLTLLTNHEAALSKQLQLENELATETKIANQALADEFIEDVSNLTDILVASDYKNAVDALNYGTLDPAVKSLIPTATQNALANHKKAVPVVTAIAELLKEETNVAAIKAIDATATDAQTKLTTIDTAVIAARGLYNALTLAQNRLVFNYVDLTGLETEIAVKQAAINNAKAVKPFKDKVDEFKDLPNVSELETKAWDKDLTVASIQTRYYSEDKAAAITAAEDLYKGLKLDQLDQQEQSDVKTEYDELTKHKGYYEKQEALIDEVTAYLGVKDAIDDFESSVSALLVAKSFDDINTLIVEGEGTPVDVYTPAQKVTIEKLIEDYGSFTSKNQVKFIAQATKVSYEAHKKALSDQKYLENKDRDGIVSALKTQIGKWDITKVTNFTTFKSEVDKANDSYSKLTEAAKTEVGSLNATKLTNYVKVIAVIEKISKLGDYSGVATSDAMTPFITPAETILNTDYPALSSSQKTIVSQASANDTTLRNYIKDAKAKQKALLTTEKLKDWNTAYGLIKDYTVHPLTLADNFNYFDVDAGEVTNIQNAREKYKVIDTDFVGEVDPDELANLEDLEAVVTKWNDINTETEAFTKAFAKVKAVDLIDYTGKTVADFETLTENEKYTDFNGLVTNVNKSLEEYGKLAEGSVYRDFIKGEKDKLDKYKASVEKYAELELGHNNKSTIASALQSWTDAYTTISGIELKGYTAVTINKDNVDKETFVAHEEGDLAKITNVRKAYKALTTITVKNSLDQDVVIDLQEQVRTTKSTEFEKLVALEAEVAAYNTALTAKQEANRASDITALKDKIAAIIVTAEDFVTKVQAAEEAYIALPAATKTYFTTNEAEEAAKLTNYGVISVVAANFKLLKTVDDINATKTIAELDTIKDAVDGVSTPYGKLTPAQVTLYAAEGTSVDTELKKLGKAIDDQRKILQNAKAIEDWTTGYAELPKEIKFTDRTYETLNTDELYSAADKAKVTALRGIYKGYEVTEGLQTLVPRDELAKLVSVEEAVAKQEKLEAELAAQSDLAPWKAAFAKLLPAAISFAVITVENFGDVGTAKYTAQQMTDIKAASTALTGLDGKTEALKFISETETKLLEEHEAAVVVQEGLQVAYDAALLTKFRSDLATIAEADNYIAAYEKLETDYAKYESKLDEDEKTNYADHGAAITVINAIIKALTDNPLASANTAAKVDGVLSALNAVNNQYVGLTSDKRKSYVKNISDLTDAISAAQSKKGTLEAEEAIATEITKWTAKYPSIPEEIFDFKGETYATINDVTMKYNVTEIANVKALRGIYDVFVEKEIESKVNKDEYNHFEKVEAAVKLQEQLQDQAAKAATNLGKLTDWNAAYAALPDIINMADLTVANYETYPHGKYPADIEAKIRTARTELDIIEADDDAKIFLEEIEVEDFEKLEESVEAYLAVKTIVDGLADWKAAYIALPAVIDVTGLTKENFTEFPGGSYSDDVFTLIETAKDAYKSLKEVEKPYAKTDFNSIAALEASVDKYFGVKLIIDGLSGWTTAFAALPAKIDTSKLTVDNYKEADFVTYADIKTKIQTAQTKLDELGQLDEKTQAAIKQADVETFAALKTSAEKYLEIKALVEGLAEWIAAYNNLPEVIDPAGITIDTIGGITYPEDIGERILTAENKYKSLEGEELNHVKSEQLAKIANLKTSVEKYEAVKAAVGRLKDYNDAYKALPNVDPDTITVTAHTPLAEDIDTLINSAELEYGKLGVDDRKLVTREKLEKIAEYKIKYAEVAEAIDQLKEWDAAYEDLPELLETDDLTVENFADFVKDVGEYATDAESKISAAREVFKGLSKIAQDNVDATEYGMLDKLSTSVVKYRQVQAAVGKQNQEATANEVIADIKEMTLENIEDAIDLMEQFNKLSPEAKALVSTPQRVSLVYYFTAAETVQLIKALPSVSDISAATPEDLTSWQEQVRAARAKYATLTATSRTYVSNLADLVEKENAVNAKVQAIANDRFLISWNAAITDLDDIDVLGFTTMSVETFATADKHGVEDKAKITKARAEYNALTTTLRAVAVVSPKDGYMKLVALEADVNAQTALENQVAATNVADYTEKVNALTGAEEDFVSQVTELNSQYNAMVSKLTTATKVRLTYLTQAAAVIEKIAALSIADGADADVIASYKAAVIDARSSYSKLSSTARAFVKNLSVLQENEVKAKTL